MAIREIIQGELCEIEGCGLIATMIAGTNNQNIGVYCVEHAQDHVENNFPYPEYQCVCPNCECLYGCG